MKVRIHEISMKPWLIFFLFLFHLPLHARAQEIFAPDARRIIELETRHLKVVSYNIKGLPSLLLSSEWKDSRYAEISRQLSGRAHVVALQEAFSAPAEALVKASGYAHVAAGPPAASLLGVSSGLFLLSRYKITFEASLAFGPALCLSWDCFSNKGVQMARLEVPGLPRPLEVFNTHLQAGREDSAARRGQVKLLVEFFRKHHVAGNPVVFAGDFNFRPGLGQESYELFRRELALPHAGRFCLERGCAKGRDEGWHGFFERAVDHQFYGEEGPVRLLPTLVERGLREPVQGLRLSDHPSLETIYEVRVEKGGKGLASVPEVPVAR